MFSPPVYGQNSNDFTEEGGVDICGSQQEEENRSDLEESKNYDQPI